MGEIDSAEGATIPPSRLREGSAEGLLPDRSATRPLPALPASGRGEFWKLPLDSLSRQEWEALCDGCGKCCLHKVEDEDTGAIYPTNVACKLLDLKTAQCSDYRNRRMFVPDCVRLTPRLAGELAWLPETCAYRLRADGKPLPDWHYLLSGDRQAVHAAGASVVGKAISETVAGPIEQHIVWSDDTDWGDDA